MRICWSCWWLEHPRLFRLRHPRRARRGFSAVEITGSSASFAVHDSVEFEPGGEVMHVTGIHDDGITIRRGEP